MQAEGKELVHQEGVILPVKSPIETEAERTTIDEIDLQVQGMTVTVGRIAFKAGVLATQENAHLKEMHMETQRLYMMKAYSYYVKTINLSTQGVYLLR